MNQLSPLLTAMAGLYAAENREGGHQAARALLAAALIEADLPEQPAGPLAEDLHLLLATDPHPLSALVRGALPWLVWIYSEMGGRIRQTIASGMMQTELVGPDGIFPHDGVRVGLWLQSAGLDYVTRAHAAEETFVILGGHALWSMNHGPAVRQEAGAVIHHPSLTPHSDCTTNDPLLAAWRWSGDISIEQYALKG